MTTRNQAAIEVLTKIKAATNRSPTNLAADVFLLASQGLAALQAAPAHTESSQFANDENPRLAGAPAQCSTDTLDGALLESIEYWARTYATSMGGGHGMVVMLLREYASLVRAHIAQRASSGDAPTAVEIAVAALEEIQGCTQDVNVRHITDTTLEEIDAVAAPAPIADEVAGDDEVGAMAYRGNTVSYMYDRAKAYGNIISECCALIGGTGDIRDRIRSLLEAKAGAPAAPALTMTTEWTEGAATGILCYGEDGPFTISGDNLHVNAHGERSLAEHITMVRDLIASRGNGAVVVPMFYSAPGKELPPPPEPAAEREDWFTLTIPHGDPALAKYTYDNYKVVGTFRLPALGDKLAVNIPPTVNADDQILLDLMEEYYGIGFNDGEWRGDNWEELCKDKCEDVVERFKAALAKRAAPAGHAEPVAKFTERGFSLIEFTDRYGVACSMQKSSLATEDAIWLGCDDASPKIMARDAAAHGVSTNETTGWVPFPIPPAVSLTTRMHLTQDQVASILPALRNFVETGEVVAAPVAAEPAPSVPAQPGTDLHASVKAAIDALVDEVISDNTATSLDPFSAGRWAGINDLKRAILARQDAVRALGCGCATCRPITLDDMRMVLCSTCGNKRCPRAADHRNECTNSNEPNQKGQKS